ncbi:MAG: hypothetical protein ACSLFP_17410, partial [Acidimicrobiales bacterium]
MRARVVLTTALTSAVLVAASLGAGALVGTFTEVEPATPDGYVFGADINSAGQSVGNAEFASGFRGFLREPDGTYTELEALGGESFSGANALNDAGDAVGQSGPNAVLWEGGGPPMDLGDLAGSTDSNAVDINDDGWIVGTTSDTGQSWYIDPADGTMTDLGTVTGGTNVQVRAINNDEAVVGRVLVGGTFLPFIWTEGDGMSLLPLPAGESRWEPSDIDDSGRIVGFTFELVDGEGIYRAHLLDAMGDYTPLTIDGYDAAIPRGMNNTGLVVGHVEAIADSGGRVPAAWDLTSGDATAFPRFSEAAFTNELNAVNDSGLAVGISREGDDFERTY